MSEIDARKMACPAPVLMVREAVENQHPAVIQVIVDNDAARQNVSRFLQSRSYTVQTEARDSEFKVTGRRGEEASDQPRDQGVRGEKPDARQKIMVMIATDRIGYGDAELGRKLMVNFIKTLKEMGADLWRLVMVNNGVKLAVAGSEVIDDLKTLRKMAFPFWSAAPA